ncbi:MAG TPA: hypothetical protein VFZ21_19990 [Gemmatimonadaceae bacterium]|nr:hypothetical protein [Gemmatimonadaceae bacterium]
MAERHATACLLLALTASVRMGAQTPERPSTAPRPVGDRGVRACSLVVATRSRIHLADSQVVHIAVGSTARRGSTVMLAGLPAYTWSATDGVDSPPRTSDSLVAVLVSEEGEVRGVPNPLVGRSVSHVKVTAGRAGTWHALFTERLATSRGHDQVTDSARFWYGRFDGRDWSDVGPVGVVHGAYTAGEYTSDLLADEEQVAFAVPIDARVGSRAIGAIVLVRRVDRRWAFDTLSGLLEPRYARLLHDPRSRKWTVFFVAPFFDNQQLVNGSLHAASWDGRWSTPKVVVRALERGVIDPRVLPSRHGVVLTWWRRAERSDAGAGPVIEWMYASSDGSLAFRPRRVIIAGSNEYVAAALGADSVLLAARDGLALDRVRIALIAGDSAVDLGILSIRNETRLGAVAAPQGGVALVASEIGRRPDEPPAASVVTLVRPVCTGP